MNIKFVKLFISFVLNFALITSMTFRPLIVSAQENSDTQYNMMQDTIEVQSNAENESSGLELGTDQQSLEVKVDTEQEHPIIELGESEETSSIQSDILPEEKNSNIDLDPEYTLGFSADDVADSTISVDISREYITGLSPQKNYEYSTNKSTWITIPSNSNEFSIYSVLSSSAIKLYVREKANSEVAASDPVIFDIGGRTTAPSTLVLVYNETLDKVVMSGWTAQMEYRISTEQDWTACTLESVVFNIPSTSTTYYVRTKGVSLAVPASLNKSLSLAMRSAAPSANFSYLTETITGITTLMEYQIDNGAWQNVTATTMDLDGTPFLYGKTVGYRVKATATAPASLTKNIIVLAQYGSATAPVLTYNPLNLTINTTSSMEYRIKGSSNWISCANSMSVVSLISTAQDVILEIRSKGVSSTTPASRITEITIPKMNGTPDVSVDISREYITGLSPQKNYEYSTNKSTWITIPSNSNEFSIYSVLSSSAIKLYVREKANSEVAASDPVIFDIGGRTTAPSTLVLVYNETLDKVVMSGWTAQMEYRISTEQDWTACTLESVVFNIPSTSTTYYVRTKGVSLAVPASLNKSLSLAVRSAAPSANFSYLTETITGITTLMEYQIDNGAWQNVTATTMDLDGTPFLYGKTVGYRVKATATAPASLTKNIIVLGLKAPPDVTYIQGAKIITTTTQMQYRILGNTTWIACSANMFIESLVSGGQTKILEVRYTGTTSQAPSLAKQVTIYDNVPVITGDEASGFKIGYPVDTSGIEIDYDIPTRLKGIFESGTIHSISENLTSTHRNCP